MGSEILSHWYGSSEMWSNVISTASPSTQFQEKEWIIIRQKLEERWGQRPAVHPAEIWKNFILEYRKNKTFKRQIHGDESLVEGKEMKLSQFLRTLIVPLFITKTAALYFGIKMTQYPGEGYGYGLVASLSLTALSFLWFVLKNPNLK